MIPAAQNFQTGNKEMPKKDSKSEALSASLPTARLTAPFGFMSRLESPRLRFDSLPFIDILMIGILIAFLQSTLIFQPGIGINLPQSTKSELAGERVSRVLSVTAEGTYFMDGRPFRTLQGVASHLAVHPPKHSSEVLLVLIPRDQPLEEALHITEMIQGAGFMRIQVAARPQRVEIP